MQLAAAIFTKLSVAVRLQAKQPTTPPGKVTPKHPFLSSSDSSDGSTSEWEQVSRAGKHRGSGKKAKAALQAKAPDVHSKPHTVTKNPDFNHIAAQKKAAPSVHASQAASSAPSNDNTHIPSNAIPYDCATWEKVGRNRNRKKILQKATSNSAVQKTASIATELPPKSSNLPFKASKNKQRRPEANTAKNAAPASIGQGAVRMPLVSLLMPMTYLWERSRKPDGSLPVGYSDMAKAYPKLSGFRTTRGMLFIVLHVALMSAK